MPRQRTTAELRAIWLSLGDVEDHCIAIGYSDGSAYHLRRMLADLILRAEQKEAGK
jgi:hypothetical protein